MPKLIVIDGNAIFHRAFHALPPFKTSKGQYTNAINGFLRMLLELLKREKPEYIAVAFDSAQKTFRHEQYQEYKAQRSAPPPELYPQLPQLKEALAIFKVACFELPGYEADDIIGTFATIAEKDPSLQTLIVTGDKDAFQLVTERTHVIVPLKGVSEVVEYTPAKVFEKMGLRPDQIVDYKSLKGDPSDNIKGIKGIGEKQAVELLQKYQHMEDIYDHLDELTQNQRQKFVDGKEEAVFSKKLATIVCDVPLEIKLEDCHFQKADYIQVKELFEQLEFKNLLKKLETMGDIVEIPTNSISTKFPIKIRPQENPEQQSLFS